MSGELLERLAAADLPAAGSAGTPAPLTISADVRNSGYKLAPVDLNLFPGGWHNLCAGNHEAAAAAIRAAATASGHTGDRVVVLGEYMTRNPAYNENLRTIAHVLGLAGYAVRVAVPAADLPADGVPGATLRGEPLVLQGMRRDGDWLVCGDGFRPDWIFNNNDFADGVPPLLEGVATPIDPSPAWGWHSRRKRDFFAAYRSVARRAADALGLDPWVFDPATVAVESVDFWNRVGLDALGDVVDRMLDEIADAYRARGIGDRPFVVVKDEAGTFGMGVLTLDSSAEVRDPNRRVRQKMQSGKGGRPIQSVLVQEGVYTRDVVKQCVGEPVVMAAAGRFVGGFFRYHCAKGISDNLNAKGMVFARLCTPGGAFAHDDNCVVDEPRRRVYGWLAEHLAAAAGVEVATRGRG